MQNAIDSKAHDRDIATRLDVNIRCALIKRILPEPIDERDNVMVVGIQRAPGLAELDQLLEVIDAPGAAVVFLGAFDRTG